jgi:hypothetical protein
MGIHFRRFRAKLKVAVQAAANYIHANPTSAGLGAQDWDFVTPLPV